MSAPWPVENGVVLIKSGASSETEFENIPHRLDAVPPIDLLTFGVSTAVIGDSITDAFLKSLKCARYCRQLCAGGASERASLKI